MFITRINTFNTTPEGYKTLYNPVQQKLYTK